MKTTKLMNAIFVLAGALFLLFYPVSSTIAQDDAAVRVPEPGILILLGIAMTAVGVASRYVRKV